MDEKEKLLTAISNVPNLPEDFTFDYIEDNPVVTFKWSVNGEWKQTTMSKDFINIAYPMQISAAIDTDIHGYGFQRLTGY